MLYLHKRLESTEGAIQNEKSRETRATLGTRHITKSNKTTTTKHTLTKTLRKTDPGWWTHVLAKSKQFLFLIRHPSYYS